MSENLRLFAEQLAVISYLWFSDILILLIVENS